MREAFVKGVGFTLGIFVGMTIINMIVGPINMSSESKDKEEKTVSDGKNIRQTGSRPNGWLL